MATYNVLTKEEHDAILKKIIDGYCNGMDKKELYKLEIQLPIRPYLAKSFKETRGLQALLNSNFNLSDAIKEYGKEFITK